MQSSQIFPLYYKDEGKKIGIKSYPNPSTKVLLAKCGILKYSKTYRSWYLPYEKCVFDLLKKNFTDLQIIADNAPTRNVPSQSLRIDEVGTDLRIIQERLGHSGIKTTERYTHVSNRTIQRVQSPLDSLMNNKNANFSSYK
ncbi:MAG: hypothetical protein IPL35_05265 [Sphingobacteriales bacterium]|nr:hypothetical protein [Sphingobacteriales bacterium]